MRENSIRIRINLVISWEGKLVDWSPIVSSSCVRYLTQGLLVNDNVIMINKCVHKLAVVSNNLIITEFGSVKMKFDIASGCAQI